MKETEEMKKWVLIKKKKSSGGIPSFPNKPGYGCVKHHQTANERGGGVLIKHAFSSFTSICPLLWSHIQPECHWLNM